MALLLAGAYLSLRYSGYPEGDSDPVVKDGRDDSGARNQLDRDD